MGKKSKKNSIQKWQEAVLITVAKHRKEGELRFGEQRISRVECKSEYKRVYDFELKNEDKEAYQERIRELLEAGEVVLKVVG